MNTRVTSRSVTERESLEIRLAVALEEVTQLRAVVAAQKRELDELCELRALLDRPTERMPVEEMSALLGHGKVE